MDNNQSARRGRVAGKVARNAAKDWIPTAKNSGKFVKHVVPAAVKPLHSLWHEVLAFIFLCAAVLAGFRMWQDRAGMAPIKFVVMGIFVLVTLGYGISSFLKARRISRS